MIPDKELIVRRERENDGWAVHMYYNAELGLYQAFGRSAYFTTAVVDPLASISDLTGLPVVMLNRSDVLKLRQSMTVVEHRPKDYYRLRTRNKIGCRWYKLWIDNISGKGGWF